MNADEQALNDHLDLHPDDMVARLVLADLLEEQGRDSESQLQRWLAANSKWPEKNPTITHEVGWCWWSDIATGREHAGLYETEVIDLMPKGERWIRDTRKEAEQMINKCLEAMNGHIRTT